MSKNISGFAPAAVLLVSLACTAHATVWYVHKDNTGPQDGTSSATAFAAERSPCTPTSAGTELLNNLY